jgi:predicted DCC family thiol-disulfide oxidoreductase YuxK
MTAAATHANPGAGHTPPILLYDDECGVCRSMARWVRQLARGPAGEPTIEVLAIGEDPEALRRLNPTLDIWKTYASNHLLMPDGSILLGGEAVAEVFRRSPGMAWCAWLFSVHVFKLQPFQRLLDLGYVILSDARPIFGCESCGAPPLWTRPFVWIVKLAKQLTGTRAPAPRRPNFSARPIPGAAKPLASPPLR